MAKVIADGIGGYVAGVPVFYLYNAPKRTEVQK
jgi:hypothetical protein